MANPVGRPTLYSQELAERICEAVANGKSGLHSIVKHDDSLPGVRTIYTWAAENDIFRQMLMRAREAQGDFLVSEGLEALDECDADDGTAHVQHARNRADYRLKMAKAIAPRIYSDKVQLAHSTPDGPVQVQSTASVSITKLTPEERWQAEELARKALERQKDDE